MRNITKIIIHCTDTPDGRDVSEETINSWHKERFSLSPESKRYTAYHFVIRLDGSMEQGRLLSEVGPHAKPWNTDSIGIVIPGRSRYPKAVWDTLKTAVDSLCKQFPSIEIVCGHRDVPGVKKTCPGFDVRSWWADGGIPDDKHILPEV